ncbi:MAG: YtxH domain-containing protein [Chitinophagaceae bacterium]
MKDNNSKLIIGVLIGAIAAATISVLISSEKGQKVVEDIKEAAGKAEKDLRKAYDQFEKKLVKGKEYATDLEKKAGKYIKQRMH